MAISGISQAKVTGVCSNCHTMHNSQGGQPMAREYSGGSLVDDPDPNPALLINDCIGCHFDVGSSTIVGNTPIVLNASLPTEALAGGNFYYVDQVDYANGHNVASISPQESPPMDVPPGFKENVSIPGGTGPASWDQQLTCAGTWGCHGNRNEENPYISIYGAHHTVGSIDGSTVGTSYRFLYGVLGAEHVTWEQGIVENPATHNGYKGNPDYAGMDTISYLCGQCHGNYHAHGSLGGTTQVGSTSPWLRHPCDISFSDVSGGYTNSEYADYTTYSSTAPVAYSSPTGSETTVDASSIIMCLSCHRAHGSPHYKLMRWDYKGWPPGTNGCNVCHTSKD